MKKFTSSERSNGELAVRRMSKKAQGAYSGADLIGVYEYVDGDASYEAEQRAEAEGRDYFPGELDVTLYAVDYDGTVDSGLTFKEAEKWLEDFADALAEG